MFIKLTDYVNDIKRYYNMDFITHFERKDKFTVLYLKQGNDLVKETPDEINEIAKEAIRCVMIR